MNMIIYLLFYSNKYEGDWNTMHTPTEAFDLPDKRNARIREIELLDPSLAFHTVDLVLNKTREIDVSDDSVEEAPVTNDAPENYNMDEFNVTQKKIAAIEKEIHDLNARIASNRFEDWLVPIMQTKRDELNLQLKRLL